MRLFFCLFLLAWVAGIALGVSGVGILLTLIISLAAVFSLSQFSFHAHVLAAAKLLFLLGFVWGWQNQAEALTCFFPDSFHARVIQVQRISESSVRYVVRIEDNCDILLTSSRFPLYGEGDVLFVIGTVQALHDMPLEYAGYARYLARQGISGTMQFASVAGVDVGSSSANDPWHYMAGRMKAVFSEPESGILRAMLLGDRGGIPPHIEASLRQAGLSHVLAISGLHISLLAGMMYGMVSFLPVSSRFKAFAVVAMLWVYIVFIGMPVSAVRAGVFWSISLFAIQLQALVGLPAAFLAALVFLVTAHPLIIYEAGFQLSFAAVAGIGAALFLFRPYASSVKLSFLFRLLLVSLGAIAATWPIVAVTFGNVPLVGLLSNVLVVPLVPVLLALGIVSLIAHVIAPVAGFAFAYGVRAVWGWIEFVAASLGSLRYGYIDDLSMSSFAVVGYYAFLLAVFSAVLYFQRRMVREIWQ